MNKYIDITEVRKIAQEASLNLGWDIQVNDHGDNPIFNDVSTNPVSIARYIDHTILKAQTTKAGLSEFCMQAVKFPFASVCVNPANVGIASEILSVSGMKVCSVVGFPLGANLPEIKAMEAELAIKDGAKEIDMVINIGALKSGRFDYVLEDIRTVKSVCREENVLLKVIIETCYLTDIEKIIASVLSEKAGADYVKTSTGFGPSGANARDIAIMRSVTSIKSELKPLAE